MELYDEESIKQNITTSSLNETHRDCSLMKVIEREIQSELLRLKRGGSVLSRLPSMKDRVKLMNEEAFVPWLASHPSLPTMAAS